MNGTDAEIAAYDKQEGVTFPSVSGSAGAGEVIMKYINGGGMTFPTLAVIAPDRKIVKNYEAYNSFYDNLSGDLKKFNINATNVIATSVQQSGSLTLKMISSNQVSVIADEAGNYTLALYSPDGSEIITACANFLTKGNHTMSWNTGSVGCGVLILRASCGQRNVVTKGIVLLKK